MTLPYKEGTWFSVPLRNGRTAVGIVARVTGEGGIAFCYFFGPARTSIPKLDEVTSLKPDEAFYCARIGDLFLLNGKWSTIGNSVLWNRSDWCMPPFIRRDDISRKAWRVYYSDVDPNSIDHEVPEPYESKLERDAVLGAGAVERILTKLLASK